MPASSSAQRTRKSRTRPWAKGGTQRNALSVIIAVLRVSLRWCRAQICASLARRPRPPVVLIAVVALHPVAEVAVLRLVAPLGHDVEPAIDREEHLAAAAI